MLLAHRQRSAAAVDGSPSPSMILVLSPTRELAQQITVEAEAVSSNHKLSVATFVGTYVHTVYCKGCILLQLV